MEILNKVCEKKIDKTDKKIIKISNATRIMMIAIWLIHVLNLTILCQQ